MTKKNIDELIESETVNLAALEKKRAEFEIKVRASKSALEKYKMMKDSEQFNSISNVLYQKGMTFEDIIAAINSGDLKIIQEKLNNPYIPETAEN